MLLDGCLVLQSVAATKSQREVRMMSRMMIGTSVVALLVALAACQKPDPKTVANEESEPELKTEPEPEPKAEPESRSTAGTLDGLAEAIGELGPLDEKLASIDTEPDTDSDWFVGLGLDQKPSFDLRKPSDEDRPLVRAMGFFVRIQKNELRPSFFEGEHFYVPAWPHSHAWAMDKDDESFKKWSGDRVVTPAAGRGTGSFVADDVVLTARHVFIDSDITEKGEVWFVMDEAFLGPDAANPYQWRTREFPDRAFGPDGRFDTYLEIDSKYVLAVEVPFAGSAGSVRLRLPDWMVVRVKAREGSIPDHPNFCLALDDLSELRRVVVPGHPRNLPLKISEGLFDPRGIEPMAVYSWFDVAGGTSGAPLLVGPDDGLQVVGVHMGSSDVLTAGGRHYARLCRQPGEEDCKWQPATPVATMRAASPEISQFNCDP